MPDKWTYYSNYVHWNVKFCYSWPPDICLIIRNLFFILGLKRNAFILTYDICKKDFYFTLKNNDNHVLMIYDILARFLTKWHSQAEIKVLTQILNSLLYITIH